MFDFYISTDLVDSRIFIAPVLQPKDDHSYLIEFSNMGEAEKSLKKLNAHLIKSPLLSPDSFKKMESIQVKLGELQEIVDVYRLIILST